MTSILKTKFLKKNNCYVMSNNYVTKIENRIISKIDIRTSIFIRHNAWIEQCISFLKFLFFSFSRFNFVTTFIHNIIFASFQQFINVILFDHSIVKLWLYLKTKIRNVFVVMNIFVFEFNFLLKHAMCTFFESQKLWSLFEKLS